MHPISRLATVCLLLTLASCASQPTIVSGEASLGLAAVVIRTDPESCAAQLRGSRRSLDDELDSSDIKIVNWNLQKGANPEWIADLSAITGEPDLMIFQEASLNTDVWRTVAADQYRSFAPGYSTKQRITGVMTISDAEPLTQCNLINREPWIRTPKATMIIEYGLTGTDQTLLVVNAHAVNFTFGIRHFRQQIQQMQSVLSEHQGPILLSGDFNTWHGRRFEILNEVAESLDLTMLEFDEDYRKRLFGHVLDHIYIRGLQVIEATTYRVGSSDHNPMSVRLRFSEMAPVIRHATADGSNR
ncbi:MAG: endonuclease/exonuclease/phosphatase family protein [Gammaproteobacteria bacterium]|nr:endonuclease/exonuclease/phosphatase family protein [Gammaproteobacteria bacterium]